MNTLVFFIGGFSAGWVTHKIYHTFFSVNIEDNEITEASETSPVTEPVTDKTVKQVTQKTEVKIKPKRDKTEKKEKQPKQATNRVDDLSQLKGVGPKLTAALKEVGIYNYQQLYSPSIDELLASLRETGGKFTRPAITAVVERAKLAAEEK